MYDPSHVREGLVYGESFQNELSVSRQPCDAKDMQTFNLFPSGFRDRSLKDVPSQSPTALGEETTIRHDINVPTGTITVPTLLAHFCRIWDYSCLSDTDSSTPDICSGILLKDPTVVLRHTND